MKRRLRIIAICLLFGAVVNVAVAWGCALLAPNPTAITVSVGAVRPFFHRSYRGLRLLPEAAQHSTDRMPIFSRRPSVWVIHEWGLPLVSMRSESLDPASQVILPWRPLWPGFTINTLFYATLLWLLVPGLFALRRLRRFLRVKRGLCPQCAYPMGESAVCTECGGALAGRA